jgi:voltage-gated sodium channel
MGNDATAAREQARPQTKPVHDKKHVHDKGAKRQGGGIRLFAILTDNDPFRLFILGCIVVNSVLLGYDAHFGETNPYHALITHADDIFLYIFTAELALEFLAQGPRGWPRDGWNWFDFIIVGVSYLSAVPGVTALRTLRVLRVFRLVSNVPQMRRVVEALLGALPGIFATIAVLAVVFYIGAIMSTTLFGKDFPEKFGDLGRSAIVLFQLTLFDDWGNIVNEIGERFTWAPVFFIVFTVLAAFAVLNLFIGVIVDAVQETRHADAEEMKEDVADIERDVSEIEEDIEDIEKLQEDAAVVRKRILEELLALRAEVAELRSARTPPA